MDYSQKIAVKEWVTDTDEKYLTSGQAFYLKNREFFVNINGGALPNGQTIGKSTPMPANYQACQIEFPAGENYSIGTHSCDRTNEVYIFIYNSNAVNFIYRLDVNGCDIIYDEECLALSAEPVNAVPQWRAFLDVKKTCKNWGGKRLIWTDGLNIYCIDVEASLKTNSFSTPFFNDCTNPCELIQLCVPEPSGCLNATYLPTTLADRLLPNKMVDIGFQFKYRWVYYDGRKSTWSDPSSYYFQSSKGCFDSEDGFSRCMKIRLPIGNAMVAWIELAYSTNNGAEWLLEERIEKYTPFNDAQQQWYERQLSIAITKPSANYSTTDCSFDYIFCADKQPILISPADNKVYNPFPRKAQTLIPFKDSIAFINYEKGNCPLPKSVSDNLRITYDCNNDTKSCQKEYATVTGYAVIHEFYNHRNQAVYVLDGNKDTSTVQFGGLNNQYGGGFEQGWGQQFPGLVRNFTAYVEGEPEYYSELVQYRHETSGAKVIVGAIVNFGDVDVRNSHRRFLNGGGFMYQQFKIRVLKGTKGFIRLSSHLNPTVDANSSTYVVGQISLVGYDGRSNLGGINTTTIDKSKEIYFDTCDGDVDLWSNALVIRDNALDGGLTNTASAVSGYVTDSSGNPLEGLMIGLNTVATGIQAIPPSNRTDHNGFYSMLLPSGYNPAQEVDVIVNAEQSCGAFTELKRLTVYAEKGVMANANISISVVDYATYINNYYLTTTVQVNDCNGNPVSGIKVALSGSKAQSTLSSGKAIFKVRNYSTRDRKLKAVIVDKTGCFSQDCGGNCSPCMPVLTANAPACFTDTRRNLSMGTAVLNTESVLRKSLHLKYGGRYGFGIIAKGGCGSLSFVNKGLFLNIPKKCDTTSSDCDLKYDFTGMVLAGYKSISIVRTKNLNPFELQWVVDKAEYVDGKVKLTIQSLNDYNYNNFFKTNTIYQYLQGDRIEFIADESGKYYCDSLNYKILSPFYDNVQNGKKVEPADYFNQILIEDDGRIGKIIKAGTIIEMQRPMESSANDIYYTICANIEVNADGTLKVPVGTFSTFDTYTINRKIGSTPAADFEHHSPSDFWGDHLTDIGTPNIVNQFEDEKRYGRNITISDVDDFNSFGSLEKTIGDQEMGDIVAANITDDKILLFICENDNFIAQTADDLLRIGSNGTVVAVSGDQAISNPQPKLAGKYGCQYDSIGSIYFGDGYAVWADVNKHAYILHDYQQAKEVSFAKISTWTIKRFQDLRTWNNLQTDPLNKYRFSTGYNHISKEVMLTLKQLRHSGIDNELQPWISPNETIIYRPEDDRFYGQSSCTPEAYGAINIFNGKGAAYIVINHGEAWIHPVIPQSWGSYFGVPVDQVIGVCLNQYPEKLKQALSVEIQSQIMWFVTQVTTEKSTFLSEIPPAKFERKKDKWNAPFLYNVNSIGGLYGNQKNFAGEKPRGYFIKVIFVRDNTNKLAYHSIDNLKRMLYDELDMILFKFSLPGDSGGMDQNV